MHRVNYRAGGSFLAGGQRKRGDLYRSRAAGSESDLDDIARMDAAGGAEVGIALRGIDAGSVERALSRSQNGISYPLQRMVGVARSSGATRPSGITGPPGVAGSTGATRSSGVAGSTGTTRSSGATRSTSITGSSRATRTSGITWFARPSGITRTTLPRGGAATRTGRIAALTGGGGVAGTGWVPGLDAASSGATAPTAAGQQGQGCNNV